MILSSINNDKMEMLEGPEGMQTRLKRICSDPIEKAKAKKDYAYTFAQLGLSVPEAETLSEHLLELMKEDRPLEELEEEALQILGNMGLISILEKKLADRAQIIFDQIQAFARTIQGKILDYGIGDGQVAQLVKDHLGADIEGVDIRDYRKEGIHVPFHLLEGSQLTVADSSYGGAVVTNVLHHEAENDEILKELRRVVGSEGLLIILETVPDGKTEEEMTGDKDRTFMNDYLYNRLFHNANVPVPGTFETINGWKERFASHGMRVLGESDLGFDQPTIRDRHYLFILENAQK